MADNAVNSPVMLVACRELLDLHPESLQIRQQVEALEDAIPDRPGIAVSFCKTITETTCKTILTDRGASMESGWDLPKLVSETLKHVNLGPTTDGNVDPRLRAGADQLVRGVNQIIQGIATIRNAHGSAAHGADAYSPLLDPHYAEILARATDAVIGLLFKMHLRSSQRHPLARFRYGDHPDFDEFIDSSFGPFQVLEMQLVASESLFHTDFQAYRGALIQYKQDQEDRDSGEEAEELSE